jgi:hypothetical protein
MTPILATNFRVISDKTPAMKARHFASPCCWPAQYQIRAVPYLYTIYDKKSNGGYSLVNINKKGV